MNSETFTTEIVRMLPTLYRIVRSQLQAEADQQDAVQEAIRRGWEKKANLKNDLFLQTWMIRILLNVCHDLQREQKRMVPREMLPLPAQKEAAEHDKKATGRSVSLIVPVCIGRCEVRDVPMAELSAWIQDGGAR